jgi:DNA-binding NtrC family response regulator
VTQSRLLVIEDDRLDRLAFERCVRTRSLPYRCVYAASVAESKALLEHLPFDAILSDYRLGDGTGLELLALDLDIPLILVTGAGSEEIAARAMRAGARDYLVKDRDGAYLDVLPAAIARALGGGDDLAAGAEIDDFAVVGGPRFASTRELLGLAIASTSPVFITGETGTGKNRVARAIHYQSSRRAGPFVPINCAAIPDHLFEGELFGYERGAFTGATTAKRGVFEQASGGTLVLDELGEMPAHQQAKLLGVLDDGKVRRLGSETPRDVDVRVICTTNVDVERALDTTFRRDLFYRLSVIRIALPALRDRAGDIPALCEHLLRTMRGGSPVPLAAGELARLMAYPWPGNVRELRNILERALILHRAGSLRPSRFLTEPAPALPAPGRAAHGGAVEEPGDDGAIPTLREVEERHIRWTLERLGGNVTQTARALGISLSTTKRKLKEYDLR